MNTGHSPEVRALADAMLRQGHRSPEIRTAIAAAFGVYVSKWTVNIWREKNRRAAGPTAVEQQLARLDSHVAAARQAEEERLGRLRRVPPLCSPEQATRQGRVG